MHIETYLKLVFTVAPNQGGTMQNNQNMNTNMNTNMNNVNTNMNNINSNMNTNMNTNMNNMNNINTNMNNMNNINTNMNNMNTNMNPNMMQPGMNTQSFTFGTPSTGINNVGFQGNSGFTSSRKFTSIHNWI